MAGFDIFGGNYYEKCKRMLKNAKMAALKDKLKKVIQTLLSPFTKTDDFIERKLEVLLKIFMHLENCKDTKSSLDNKPVADPNLLWVDTDAPLERFATMLAEGFAMEDSEDGELKNGFIINTINSMRKNHSWINSNYLAAQVGVYYEKMVNDAETQLRQFMDATQMYEFNVAFDDSLEDPAVIAKIRKITPSTSWLKQMGAEITEKTDPKKTSKTITITYTPNCANPRNCAERNVCAELELRRNAKQIKEGFYDILMIPITMYMYYNLYYMFFFKSVGATYQDAEGKPVDDASKGVKLLEEGCNTELFSDWDYIFREATGNKLKFFFEFLFKPLKWATTFVNWIKSFSFLGTFTKKYPFMFFVMGFGLFYKWWKKMGYVFVLAILSFGLTGGEGFQNFSDDDGDDFVEGFSDGDDDDEDGDINEGFSDGDDDDEDGDINEGFEEGFIEGAKFKVKVKKPKAVKVKKPKAVKVKKPKTPKKPKKPTVPKKVKQDFRKHPVMLLLASFSTPILLFSFFKGLIRDFPEWQKYIAVAPISGTLFFTVYWILRAIITMLSAPVAVLIMIFYFLTYLFTGMRMHTGNTAFKTMDFINQSIYSRIYNNTRPYSTMDGFFRGFGGTLFTFILELFALYVFMKGMSTYTKTIRSQDLRTFLIVIHAFAIFSTIVWMILKGKSHSAEMPFFYSEDSVGKEYSLYTKQSDCSIPDEKKWGYNPKEIGSGHEDLLYHADKYAEKMSANFLNNVPGYKSYKAEKDKSSNFYDQIKQNVMSKVPIPDQIVKGLVPSAGMITSLQNKRQEFEQKADELLGKENWKEFLPDTKPSQSETKP